MRSVDSYISFLGNKTYWLFGLTGGLGLSLCEWMVQRGARYCILSSRNPNIEAAWLHEMDAKKVVVKISTWLVIPVDEYLTFPSNITNFE